MRTLPTRLAIVVLMALVAACGSSLSVTGIQLGRSINADGTVNFGRVPSIFTRSTSLEKEAFSQTVSPVFSATSRFSESIKVGKAIRPTRT